jgi:uncharacterized protein YggT (Ycf19 family)
MTYDPYAETRPDHERVTVERHVDATPVVDREVVVTPATVRTSPIDTVRRLVWLLFGILQVLIILRIVLLLLGANEGNDLVAFILAVTNPFVEPFRGMFSLDEVNAAGGSILDIAAVVALIAWTLVEALVLGIVGLADRRPATA